MKKRKKKYVILENGGELEIEYLREQLNECRQYTWAQKVWKPRPALIDKNGGSSREYIDQKFDPGYLKLVENGWTHDHCEICVTWITDEDNAYESEGLWICNSCFNNFIEPNTIESALEKQKQVEK